jgi:hypothetical protein
MKDGTMPSRGGFYRLQWLVTMMFLRVLKVSMTNFPIVNAFAPPKCHSRFRRLTVKKSSRNNVVINSNKLFMAGGDGSEDEWVKGKMQFWAESAYFS